MNLVTLSEILDRPIAFQRPFVKLGVGIKGALMLSQAVYWSKRTRDADGWFYKTQEEWEEETGLVRSEQETARKKLIKSGVMQEVKKGVPCKLYYRVDLEKILSILSATFSQSSMQESPKLDSEKVPNKRERKSPAITETTAETTQETTQETKTETTADTLPEGSAAPNASGLMVVSSSSQSRVEIPSDMPGPKDPECKTFKAWANYAFAYRKRYQAWPVWNAKVAGQVGQLVNRLGADIAHHVAAYYVSINDARLINDCHSLNNLLAKAEAYHTQWATNRQMNGTTARQLEQTQANINAAHTAAESIRSKEGKRNAFL
jgi:hypothetical protein